MYFYREMTSFSSIIPHDEIAKNGMIPNSVIYPCNCLSCDDEVIDSLLFVVGVELLSPQIER